MTKKLFTLPLFCLAATASALAAVTVNIVADEAPYVYAWNGATEYLGAYPGVQLNTLLHDNAYPYWQLTIEDADNVNIIISDGNPNEKDEYGNVTAYHQTEDINGLAGVWWLGYTGKNDYCRDPRGNDIQYYAAAQFIYYIDYAGLNRAAAGETPTVYAHVWADDNGGSTKWPGVPMVKMSQQTVGGTYDVYRVNLDDLTGYLDNSTKTTFVPQHIIFNNGLNSDQTGAKQSETLEYATGSLYGWRGTIVKNMFLPIELNATNFPDANLRDGIEAMCGYAITSVTTGTGDNAVTRKFLDASHITELNVSNRGVSNIKGLELLPNLADLNLGGSNFGTLDITGLAALKKLNLDNNNITSISAITGLKQIEDLSLKQNKLTTFDAGAYGTQGGLTELLHLNLDDNQLESIDISASTRLISLWVERNYKIDALDISANTELYTLFCSDNKLTELNIDNNKHLYRVQANRNHITSFTVSAEHTALYELELNDNEIPTLDCSMLPVLAHLECARNGVVVDNVKQGMTDLKVSPASVFIECSQNDLTKLDVSQCADLDYLRCYHNRIPDLNVSNNKVLKTLDACENPTDIDVTNNRWLEVLDIDQVGVNGIGTFTELDLTDKHSLYRLRCSNNKLTVLDVTPCDSLLYFDCKNNLIAGTIDTHNNKMMLEFDCGTNAITSLDLQNNTKLTTMKCNNNLLDEIDVTWCPDLKIFDTQFNTLQVLNLANNKQLDELQVQNNHLWALDLSNNTKLHKLFCEENRINALDLSANTNLGVNRVWKDAADVEQREIWVTLVPNGRYIYAEAAEHSIEFPGRGYFFYFRMDDDTSDTGYTLGDRIDQAARDADLLKLYPDAAQTAPTGYAGAPRRADDNTLAASGFSIDNSSEWVAENSVSISESDSKYVIGEVMLLDDDASHRVTYDYATGSTVVDANGDAIYGTVNLYLDWVQKRDESGEVVITAITDLSSDSDADVTSVRYTDPAGRTSATPFSGVNIVVTTHADGSTVVTKEIRR